MAAQLAQTSSTSFIREVMGNKFTPTAVENINDCKVHHFWETAFGVNDCIFSLTLAVLSSSINSHKLGSK